MLRTVLQLRFSVTCAQQAADCALYRLHSSKLKPSASVCAGSCQQVCWHDEVGASQLQRQWREEAGCFCM